MVFIQDRIAPEHWFYVPSESNPSDVGSRGLFPSELVLNTMWFQGPEFLQDTNSPLFDTFSPVQEEDEVLKEARNITLVTHTVKNHPLTDLLSLVLIYYSKYPCIYITLCK